MQHWIIYCYQRARSRSALLGCTRSRVGTMHFFYAAVMGVDCRDSYLLTGKLHTLGTAEVTSIAGLQSTEGKKKGKGRKKKKVSLEHGQQVWSGSIHSSDARWWGRDWMMSSPLFLLTSLPHDHSSPSLLGLRVPSTSCALEQGNANNIKAFNSGVAFLL